MMHEKRSARGSCSVRRRISGWLECVLPLDSPGRVLLVPSFASEQTAARKAGFMECERLAYRDFRFHGRAVFAGIEPPHTDVILFEREFEHPKQRHAFLRPLIIRGRDSQCLTSQTEWIQQQ